jgi:hypothetical protein
MPFQQKKLPVILLEKGTIRDYYLPGIAESTMQYLVQLNQSRYYITKGWMG